MPSSVTGSSHICASGCPGQSGFMHPAIAGGAAVISPPAIRTAASPPVMNCFMSLLLPRRVAGSVVDVRRRVIEGGTPKDAGQDPSLAAVIEPAVVGRGARQSFIRRVEYHATLPGAVWLDGRSHLLAAIHPPYRQPALAGGAEPTSPPVISAAARPPTRYCFMVLSLTSPLATTLLVRWAAFAVFDGS